MKKYILDLRIVSVSRMNERYVLLKLTGNDELPEMLPGQFAEIRVDESPTTFLRRPISIHFIDRERNELWLLVATVGSGTRRLARLHPDDRLNVLLPLGNTFRLNQPEGQSNILLVGGGVGVAPLLFYGKWLMEQGLCPTFLLGARTAADLLMLDNFNKYGRVYVTTEDGSAGEKGFVTNHSILSAEHFTQISTCGPKPMMMAVARYARERGIYCEASLENMMACGLGACLCCVENTTDGNLCVCKEGPVFDIEKLRWS